MQQVLSVVRHAPKFLVPKSGALDMCTVHIMECCSVPHPEQAILSQVDHFLRCPPKACTMPPKMDSSIRAFLTKAVNKAISKYGVVASSEGTLEPHLQARAKASRKSAHACKAKSRRHAVAPKAKGKTKAQRKRFASAASGEEAGQSKVRVQAALLAPQVDAQEGTTSEQRCEQDAPVRSVPLLKEFPVFNLPLDKRPLAMQPAADPRLTEPANYLSTLLGKFNAKLTESTKEAMRRFLAQQPIHLASVCAGTDCARLVLEKFRESAQQWGCTGIDLKHAFSAEVDEEKRKWLRAAYGSNEPLYGDVSTLTIDGEGPWDWNTNAPTPVPNFDCLVGGFPCKDVSYLNVNRKANRDSLKRRTGKTGSAFAAIRELLSQRSEPVHGQRTCVFGFLENVKGLASGSSTKMDDGEKPHADILTSNLATCMDQLYSSGYFPIATMVDPRNFGHPQSRPRFYIPFVSKLFLAQFQIAEEEWHRWYVDHLSKFGCGLGMASSESFMLPEDNILVSTERGKQAQAHCSAESAEALPDSSQKWPLDHIDKAREKGLVWWRPANFTPEQKERFPALQAIPARQLDILLLSGVQFPEAKLRLIELSQSAGRNQYSEHSVGCMTPKMRRWATSRCRLLHGAESMFHQGLFFDEKVLRGFSSDFLLDLSGNAFHAGCAAACFFTSVVACAIGFERHAKSNPVVQSLASEDVPDVDVDDNDIEEWDLGSIF